MKIIEIAPTFGLLFSTVKVMKITEIAPTVGLLFSTAKVPHIF
jgi:hypothetical protein